MDLGGGGWTGYATTVTGSPTRSLSPQLSAMR